LCGMASQGASRVDGTALTCGCSGIYTICFVLLAFVSRFVYLRLCLGSSFFWYSCFLLGREMSCLIPNFPAQWNE
jgi:hypothetical protein